MTFHDGYYFSNGKTRVFNVDDDGTVTSDFELCEEIKIIRVIKIINEKPNVRPLFKVMISLTQNDGKIDIFEVNRSEIVEHPISTFVQTGLTIADTMENATTLKEILLETGEKLPHEYVCERLGFVYVDEKLVYLGTRGFPAKANVSADPLIAPSSKGTFEAWRDGLQPFVESRPELQLALAMGASAPVVTLLNICNVFKDSLIWAFVGGSSTGKTSAMKLSASPWGSSNIGTGLINTMFDTENFLFATLTKKYGFPHFIDEASIRNKADFTAMIYQLSMGSERGRCNNDGSPKEIKHWSSSITFTSEKSLLLQTNQNKGLYARLVEFACKWTENGKSANKILKIIGENHGVAWLPFIKTLMKTGKKDLIQMFEDQCEYMKTALNSKDGVDDRISQRLAILLVTLDLMGKAWDFKIDIPAITDIFVATYNENINQDPVQTLYENLLNFVVEHADMFPNEKLGSSEDFPVRKWGIRAKYQGRRCIWYIDEKFEELLLSFPNTNLSSTRRELRDRGMIGYFDESYKRRTNIDHTHLQCYCLFLEDEAQIVQKKQIKSKLKNKI